MAVLLIRNRAGSEWRMLLERRELNIGREPDNEVVLQDEQVSRHHARLVDTGQGWLLEDMGSVNGTRLGGQRISRQLVQPGEPILVGSTLLVLEEPTAPVDRSMALPIQQTPLPAFQAQLPLADLRSGGGLPMPPLPASLPPPLPATAAIPRGGDAGALAQPQPKARRSWGLVLGAGCSGLLLGGVAVASLFLWPWKPPAPQLEPQRASTAAPEAAVAAFQRALAAGDLEGALSRVDPSFRDTLRQSFQAQPERMPKLAAALGARRLLLSDDIRAEFEVSEDGRAFTIVFQNTSGTWMLSAL